mmetsp:Transcript_39461/g.55575  ORF Transcript_39461/g.55575 Transcript_39461/m.55575 type:complete len:372 (+) Transcript_39461:99-1214(+)
MNRANQNIELRHVLTLAITYQKETVDTSNTIMSNETITPHDNDILMGRGGKNNQWVGNENLRVMAREQSENYRMSSKKGKSYISRELVRKVRQLDPPGRFLKKNTGTGEWEDVGDQVAREKASQVLRDAVSVVLTSPNDASEEELSHEMEQKTENDHRRSNSAPPVMGSKRRRETAPIDSWSEYNSNSNHSIIIDENPTLPPTPVVSNPQSILPARTPSNPGHYTQVTPLTHTQSKRRRFHVSHETQSQWEDSRSFQNPPYHHSPNDRHHSRHYSHTLPPQHPGNPQYQRPQYARSMSYNGRYRPPHPVFSSQGYPYNSYNANRDPPPPTAIRGPNLMGEVQPEGFDEFDLFNGELLKDPSEEEANSVSTS